MATRKSIRTRHGGTFYSDWLFNWWIARQKLSRPIGFLYRSLCNACVDRLGMCSHLSRGKKGFLSFFFYVCVDPDFQWKEQYVCCMMISCMDIEHGSGRFILGLVCLVSLPLLLCFVCGVVIFWQKATSDAKHQGVGLWKGLLTKSKRAVHRAWRGNEFGNANDYDDGQGSVTFDRVKRLEICSNYWFDLMNTHW